MTASGRITSMRCRPRSRPGIVLGIVDDYGNPLRAVDITIFFLHSLNIPD
jgi:hypothetical protein